MNGSSSRASPSDSGMKKRLRPTLSASDIFSSVPRLGVICPLSIRERYDRETRERACNWLCVMLRDSRNCRMRCPMFSTVSWLGHLSGPACSPACASGGAGGGMRNSSLRRRPKRRDRKSTRLNSSHGYISYAVFCLKKKKHSNRARVPPQLAAAPTKVVDQHLG